jgi:predicted PurR-regulated permease PerM
MPDRYDVSGRNPQRAVKWTIFLGAAALIVYLCALVLSPFLKVIGWSAVLAIAFSPVHQRLVRATGHVTMSAVICSVLVVFVILVPLFLLSALAVNQFLTLKDYLEARFSGGFSLTSIGPLRPIYEWVTARFELMPGEIERWIMNHGAGIGRTMAEYSLSIAAGLTNLVISFVFIIFATFLLFRQGEPIVRRIPDLLPFERTRSEAMLSRIQDVIYASVYGVLVIALLQGALAALMFWILGVPSAALWGMVTILTSVLPIVGAAGVWVPATIYLVLTGSWIKAIVLVAWGTLVISSVDNFLRPRLVGGRVGLSELVMFFALLGGLQVFGVLGIVLGPVVFAIAASILDVLSEGDAALSDTPRITTP